MKVLSILACKITYKLLTKINRGSNLPGAIALKIDKHIFEKLKLPKNVIVVTGSSGKGSTTSMIANILENNGYEVCHNKEGANQLTGILTALLRNSKLDGTIKKDVVVLEIDERSVKYIFPNLKPTDVVITNITRDQPPRQIHTDFIIEEIKKGLNKNCKLYLNANDPILRNFNITEEIETVYFELQKTNLSYEKNLFKSINNPRCPKCHSILKYDYYHFEDLGNYKCIKCDFKTPKSKYAVTSYNEKNNQITINDEIKLKINNNMLYNIYNTLAAYSVVKELGIKDEKISESLNKTTKTYTKKVYNNRNVYVLNNKCENSTTYNQSILYTTRNKKEKTIILGWAEISRRYIWDDLSWLYDIEFELLKEQKIDKIIVTGPQRYDLAVRLKYAGINEKKIKIEKDILSSKQIIKKSKGDIYAILNFDYLGDFKKVMEELGWK